MIGLLSRYLEGIGHKLGTFGLLQSSCFIQYLKQQTLFDRRPMSCHVLYIIVHLLTFLTFLTLSISLYLLPLHVASPSL